MQSAHTLLFLLLAAAANMSFADSPMPKSKLDPVAQADEACMDKADTTAAMVECADGSYKRWDGELNRVYGVLRKKFDKGARQALTESQQKWLVYRDAELKTLRALYGGMQGTMYIPMGASAAADLIKTRANELRGYLDVLDMQDGTQ